VRKRSGLRDALASSSTAPLRAPPAWTNAELGIVNGVSVLDAAPGEAILIAAGERHRASVADGCLPLSVETVGMTRSDG